MNIPPPAFFPLIFCTLLFFTLAPSKGSAETIIEEIAGKGMYLESTPSGATVYIDGIERGKTPLTLDNLPPGTHLVTLEKDRYENWSMPVSYTDTGKLHIICDLVPRRGQLILYLIDGRTKSPLDEDALILVDGLPQTYQKEDGALILRLKEGRKTLSVRVFGYETIQRAMVIDKESPLAAELVMQPAPLRLDRLSVNRSVFNPYNQNFLGTVTVNFFVSASGFGRLLVFDRDGTRVQSRILNKDGTPFSDWAQNVAWDGRKDDGTPFDEGLYLLRLEVSDKKLEAQDTHQAAIYEQRWIRIDYSAEIVPLSLNKLRPGLSHAEYSRLLPQGSFQVMTTLSAEIFDISQPAWGGQMPFSIGFRWSFAAFWETGAAVNIAPFQDGKKTVSQAALGIRREFLHAQGVRPGISLGASYSLANRAGNDSGLVSELALNQAVSWSLAKSIELLFSPALLWTNLFQEYVPCVEVGAGLLWKRSALAAGISARQRFLFTDEESAPFQLACDIFYIPPPSNLVLGAQFGFDFRKTRLGFAAGIALGVMF